MIGMEVTRDVVLRVLKDLDREVMRLAAVEHEIAKKTGRPGAYAAWVDKHEERSAVIEALENLVRALPPRTVLVKGETRGSSVAPEKVDAGA